ncbi:MAG: M1 family metallopeptidase [Candidatus Heimdallarchaeota archaeon]|nr:M1 family metallopeptidase [Candidatus Heimdallarchaeota archaeon]
MVSKHKFFPVIFFVIIIASVLFGSVTTTIEEQTLEEPTLFNKNEMPILSTNMRQDKGESLGEQNTFWVVDPNTGNYEQVTAKLLSIGQYCYIYVDLTTISAIGETEATDRSNSYSSEFDSNMYSTNLELVGHPDGFIGDIDGDPKITVLISPESYGGVYFFKDDDPTHPYSNNREMVYIHSNLNELRGYNTIIHELNHLIWFNHEQDEAIFVLEGTAEYSRYKAGYLNNESYISAHIAADYNLTYKTNYFKGHPESSLLYWDYDDNILNRASYGRSYMFMLYLSERFGEGFLTELVTIIEDGPAGIEKALRNRGLNHTFNEIFLDWITACTIDLESFADGKFGYQTADFKISSLSEISQLPYLSAVSKYKLYGFNVRRINSPPNEFTVKITNPKPHVLGISAVINDENGWNITQVICPDNDEEEIYLYYSGKDINNAYIITSIISLDTPYAPSFLYPRLTAPYKYLTLTILDGHVTVEVSENANLRILYTGLSIIISSIVINLKRKSKR